MTNLFSFIASISLISLCALLNFSGVAQEKVLTAGIQLKPILPFEQIRSNTEQFSTDEVNYTLRKRNGYAAGMVIRNGITNWFSLEVGMNFVARNFNLQFNDPVANYSVDSDFRLIAYEIPVSGLVYIRLADDIYMNASLGAGLSFFPSDVATKDPRTNVWFHLTNVRAFAWPGLSANLGWEYRTREKGTYYIGGSWQSFFTEPFQTYVRYSRPGGATFTESGINHNGTYLTIDLRYFFHEPPQKAKRKKDSNKVDRLWYRQDQQSGKKK